MSFDELGKTLNNSLFVSLDRLGGRSLIKGFYALGITAVALWAINHLFFTFSLGFGAGLWGLVEITVFGLLAITGLRILSEAMIVFFQAHAADAEAASTTEIPSSLVDEVRDAIEDLGVDLGEHSDVDVAASTQTAKTQAKTQAKPSAKAAAAKAPVKSPATKAKKTTTRTARRTPRTSKPADKS